MHVTTGTCGYTFETAAWNVSSEIDMGVLLEYLKDIVITGSEFDLRLTSAVIFTTESVKVITFDDGNSLSGNADSNAHSSSSVETGGFGAGGFGVDVLERKSNMEGMLEVSCGVDCLSG